MSEPSYLKKTQTTLIASIMYSFLSALPIIGPIYTGAYIGKNVKNPKEGYVIGLFTAAAGLSIQYVLLFNGLTNSIWLFIIAAWHLFSAVLLMVGVAAGSLFHGVKNGVKHFRHTREEYREAETNQPDSKTPTYLVCGEPNKTNQIKCSSCGGIL